MWTIYRLNIMIVKELIDKLSEIEDKTQTIHCDPHDLYSSWFIPTKIEETDYGIIITQN